MQGPAASHRLKNKANKPCSILLMLCCRTGCSQHTNTVLRSVLGSSETKPIFPGCCCVADTTTAMLGRDLVTQPHWLPMSPARQRPLLLSVQLPAQSAPPAARVILHTALPTMPPHSPHRLYYSY